MSSPNRKLKRAQQKKQTKQAKKRMQQQLNMFDKLPDQCLTCEKPFDKMNREHVGSFRVVVRESEDKVNLYCDTCWDKAVSLIQEISKKA